MALSSKMTTLRDQPSRSEYNHLKSLMYGPLKRHLGPRGSLCIALAISIIFSMTTLCVLQKLHWCIGLEFWPLTSAWMSTFYHVICRSKVYADKFLENSLITIFLIQSSKFITNVDLNQWPQPGALQLSSHMTWQSAIYTHKTRSHRLVGFI